MERLSKLELERLLEIVDSVMAVVEADEEGVTWGLEEDLMEAEEMLVKALKTK
jgi:hypothetical protein